jgi:hypothetical protein
MHAGLLPDALSELLDRLGIGAIVGTSLFEQFPVVTFDYRAARVRLWWQRAGDTPSEQR